MNFLTQSFHGSRPSSSSSDDKFDTTRPAWAQRDEDQSTLSSSTSIPRDNESETISEIVADSDSSVFTFDTASTTSTGARNTDANDAFTKLRLVDGDPLEPTVDKPSIRRGDVRTWSKVEARIILWNDGTLRKGAKPRNKKELKARVRKEYVVAAADPLHYVFESKRQTNQLLFVFERSSLPRLVSMTKKSSGKSSLLGSRRTSDEDTKNMSRQSTLVPRPVTPTDREPWRDSPQQAQSERQPVEQGDDSSRTGFKSFVSNLVRTNTNNDDDNRLQLTKTRTSEQGLEMQRTRSSSKWGPTNSVDPDDGPDIFLADPLPNLGLYDVTALQVDNPASIVAVRYFPQRTRSFWSSPSLPVSTPAKGDDKPTTVSSNTASQARLYSRSSSSSRHKPSDAVVPACIEIDVAPMRAPERSPMEQNHGRAREATVGFYFLELAMASQESQEILAMIEHLMRSLPS
ncbi:hypothetical protein OIO90_005164 [Microbotryomycetes sp. JL221]|nr:hypothetical protein OIO90_005164 [Microbotryomycetes sp. JL221]